MTSIQLDQVSKRYGDIPALAGVSLRFGPGVSVVLGPNGAGKTTLSEIIGGWRQPDEGQLLFDGEPATPRTSAMVGLAPQSLAVYPTLTVAENLRVFAELAGLVGRAVRRRVTATAELVGIHPVLRRPAGTLSGGQQRCVHTAIALISDPEVLLLDEPTVGVDVEHRQYLLSVVRALGAERRTVIYTTHHLAEVADLQPRQVVVLDAGTVQFAGRLEQLPGRDVETAYLELVRPRPDHVAAA